MNAEKVKNVIIILFIILNAALFILLQLENNRFRLDAAQENAIRQLYKAHNIEISAAIPRNFNPMRSLYFLPYHYDMQKYEAFFFPDEEPERSTWLDNLELRGANDRELILSGGLLRYYNPNGHSTQTFLDRGFKDIPSSRKLADDFVRDLLPPDLAFTFDYWMDWPEWGEELLMFAYRGTYQGYMVHDNYVRIWISQIGIIRATFSFSGIPQSFSNHYREIHSADEALFAVLHDIIRNRIHGGAGGVNITDISFAYMLHDTPVDDEIFARAMPCYRITVNINGNILFYWMDAYTLDIDTSS
jgi:hypothetical protein